MRYAGFPFDYLKERSQLRGYELIDSLQYRKPDPINDRLVITVEEMMLITNSPRTAEYQLHGPVDNASLFDFMDREGNKYYCIVQHQ